MGEFVGTVKEIRGNSFTVAGTARFANGDGLCFFNDDNELEGFRVNRVEGNRLFPQQMPEHLRPGMALYRNSDQQFSRILSRPSAERRIPIQLKLGVTSNGFSLSAEGTTVTISFEHQRAAKPQHENIVRQLSKLGGTIYECSGVDIPADFDYFIPSSLLSDLRQQLVAALTSKNSPTSKNSYTSKINTVNPRDPNISNRLSQQLYDSDCQTAYELHPDSRPLMQCRHCLRYSLGRCMKHGGQKPDWREPLMLRLGDGRQFRLEFDCKHCQMNIYAAD